MCFAFKQEESYINNSRHFEEVTGVTDGRASLRADEKLRLRGNPAYCTFVCKFNFDQKKTDNIFPSPVFQERKRMQKTLFSSQPLVR